VFQFIKEVTDHVTERVSSFHHYYNDIITSDEGSGVEQLTSMIKSSFNIVLVESQGFIKQYKSLLILSKASGKYIYTIIIKSSRVILGEDEDYTECWDKAYNVILDMASSSSVEQVSFIV